MTNKGKVITAIIVVAVLLAGGTGFYFKGGDLMGRMKPAYNNVGCSLATYQTLYGNAPTVDEVYANFDDAFSFIKSEIKVNGKLLCPIRFQAFSKYETRDEVTCRGTELAADELEGGVANQIICNKNYKDFHSSVNIVKYKEADEPSVSVTYNFLDNDTGYFDVERTVDSEWLIIDRVPSTW